MRAAIVEIGAMATGAIVVIDRLAAIRLRHGNAYRRTTCKKARCLRRHFETDAENIVVAVLAALAANGEAKGDEVNRAIAAYGIDTEAPDPRVA